MKIQRWLGSVQKLPEAREARDVHVHHGVVWPTRVVCRAFLKQVYGGLMRAEDDHGLSESTQMHDIACEDRIFGKYGMSEALSSADRNLR